MSSTEGSYSKKARRSISHPSLRTFHNGSISLLSSLCQCPLPRILRAYGWLMQRRSGPPVPREETAVFVHLLPSTALDPVAASTPTLEWRCDGNY
eukprot:792981-Pyramimonas_sp.AAC.1